MRGGPGETKSSCATTSWQASTGLPISVIRASFRGLMARSSQSIISRQTSTTSSTSNARSFHSTPSRMLRFDVPSTPRPCLERCRNDLVCMWCCLPKSGGTTASEQRAPPYLAIV